MIFDLVSQALLAAGGAGEDAKPKEDDRRTEAEKIHEQKARQAEERLRARMASKSNKEKVQEFNTYLSARYAPPSCGPPRAPLSVGLHSAPASSVSRSCQSTTTSRASGLGKACRSALIV